jgi:hypothetical protein
LYASPAVGAVVEHCLPLVDKLGGVVAEDVYSKQLPVFPPQLHGANRRRPAAR